MQMKRTHRRPRLTTVAVAMLRSHLPALEKAARADRKDFRIGVLVRSRKHIGLIASALRAEGIPYRRSRY